MNKTLMLASFCALLWCTSCSEKEEEKEEITKFLVTTPLKKDTTITKDYVCQIHAFRHIELRAQQRGYLQNIYVTKGSLSKKAK